MAREEVAKGSEGAREALRTELNALRTQTVCRDFRPRLGNCRFVRPKCKFFPCNRQKSETRMKNCAQRSSLGGRNEGANAGMGAERDAKEKEQDPAGEQGEVEARAVVARVGEGAGEQGDKASSRIRENKTRDGVKPGDAGAEWGPQRQLAMHGVGSVLSYPGVSQSCLPRCYGAHTTSVSNYLRKYPVVSGGLAFSFPGRL
eukprot:652794-Pleurochrysis_carterae.AAC.1